MSRVRSSRFEGVTLPLRRRARARRRRPDDRRAAVRRHRRPVGVGQDDAAARDHRLRSRRRAGRSTRRDGLRHRLRAAGRDRGLELPGHGRGVRADGAARAAARCRGRAGPSGARSTTCSSGSGIGELGRPPHPRAVGRPAAAGVPRPRAAAPSPTCCCSTSRPRASTSRIRHEILHLLDDLNADGLAIVLTTHDLNGIAAHLPQLVCLNRAVDRRRRAADRCSRPTSSSGPTARAMDVLDHAGVRVVVDVRPHVRGRGLRRDGSSADRRAAAAVRVRVLPQRRWRSRRSPARCAASSASTSCCRA